MSIEVLGFFTGLLDQKLSPFSGNFIRGLICLMRSLVILTVDRRPELLLRVHRDAG